MSEQNKFVERRKHPRAPTRIAGTIRTRAGTKQDVAIHELSATGCSVTTQSRSIANAVGYSVKIKGLEALESDLRWQSGSKAGFEFARPLHPAIVDHLVNMHPPKPDPE